MSVVPIYALVTVGVILVVLGLLAAGSLELIALGVAAILGAGVLAVVADRGRRAA